ncbi:MAG: hypothetical protein ACKVX7_19875 [Planctomycetota bacterium]
MDAPLEPAKLPPEFMRWIRSASSNDPQPTSFRAAMTRRLRQAGLKGEWAQVLCMTGALDITGQHGGQFTVTPTDVARMRVGFLESKYGKHFVWRLWFTTETVAPMDLSPIRRPGPEYGATVRAFAQILADVGALDRIQSGVSRFSALFFPVLFGGLLLAACAVFIFFRGNESAWGLLATAVPFGFLFSYSTYRTATRHWPCRIARLEELDRQLT